jgi:hypothetical protein
MNAQGAAAAAEMIRLRGIVKVVPSYRALRL